MNEPLHIAGYEILRELASGGMGQLLLARKCGAFGFERLVALKTVRPELCRSSDARAMFLDEARLMARIEHPAIAQVFDFGEDGETPYLAMEYLAGLTFFDLIARRDLPLDPGIAARLVADACWGLQAVHDLKGQDGRSLEVVHRDLTPENLLLTFSGQVKVLDFGIALFREREAPVTAVGSVRGKLGYFAPEQYNRGPIDRRTDVFVISLVLGQLLVRRVEAAPDPLAPDGLRCLDALGPLPKGLEEILRRGLNPEPSLRFPDARSLAMALEDVARRAGTLSTFMFADQALARDRASHARWLEGVLEGRGAAPQGRLEPGSTVEMAPAEEVAPKRITVPGVSFHGFEHEPLTDVFAVAVPSLTDRSSAPIDRPIAASGDPSRWPSRALSIGLVGIGMAVAALVWSLRSPASVSEPPTGPSAGVESPEAEVPEQNAPFPSGASGEASKGALAREPLRIDPRESPPPADSRPVDAIRRPPIEPRRATRRPRARPPAKLPERAPSRTRSVSLIEEW